MSDISRVEQLEAALAEMGDLFTRYRDAAIEAVAAAERERDEARAALDWEQKCVGWAREERDRAIRDAKLLEGQRDAARAVARELLPTCRREDPRSVRWHAEMREKFPWLKAEG